LSIVALSGAIGGLAGIGALNALVGEYHEPVVLGAVVVVVVVVVVVEVVEVVVVGVLVEVVVDVVVVGAATAGATTPVALEVAIAEPFLFVAVIATRSVEPASAVEDVYALDVAPPSAEHADPLASHFSQRYVYVGLGPLHVPAAALRLCPTEGVPVIDGEVVFSGADCPGALFAAAPTAPGMKRKIERIATGISFLRPMTRASALVLGPGTLG
jgi:hypothetical protein